MASTVPRPRTWLLLALLAIPLTTARCGSTGDKEDDDSGGDHLPDDEVYMVASIPDGAAGAGLAARELRAPALRRFVRLAPRYHVCLDAATFDDATLRSLEARLKVRAGAVAAFGLEGIVNRVLRTVDRFSPGTPVEAGLVEIHLLRPEFNLCHLYLTRAAATEFPFVHQDFAGKTRVVLQDGQLRTDAGRANGIPVGFVEQSLAAADALIAAEYAIGVFLGLGESALLGSYLNGTTSTALVTRGYFSESTDGSPRVDDDAQILYSFALVYREVVKTADLDAYYHYQDELHPTERDQDLDLVDPLTAVPIAFEEVLGNAYVHGARAVGDRLPVCIQNPSGVVLDDASVAAYFAFATPDVADGIIGYLAAREPAIRTRVSLVDDGCSLIVTFRNATQYPFAGRDVHGLYAPEGTVKSGAGVATTLPVIYLNAATLDLDPAALGTSAKPVSLVLQHEFAHFLGLRHSPSAKSILSPAGYNASWDEAGGDGKMFDAFVQVWRP